METVVAFEAQIRGTGCVKIDGDKSSVVKLMIPIDGMDAVGTMSKYFTECGLRVVLVNPMGDQVSFEASVQGNGCFKVNAKKSLAMTILVPASGIDAVTDLVKKFSEVDLKVGIERV